MSNTMAMLKRKINGANELQSVVRTMKSVAASGIGQYEKSTLALADYDRTIELGLGACFREEDRNKRSNGNNPTGVKSTVAVIFGSDQGLVGQFNDTITQFAQTTLKTIKHPLKTLAVGERVHASLTAAKTLVAKEFVVPRSVQAIAPLVGDILVECENCDERLKPIEMLLFYNRTAVAAGSYSEKKRVLPLDQRWKQNLINVAWQTPLPPQIMDGYGRTLRALIHEYLFVSIFRACAESLASENASRLAAMERADKNIQEMLSVFNVKFHRLRQGGIDEELFGVISSFDALTGGR